MATHDLVDSALSSPGQGMTEYEQYGILMPNGKMRWAERGGRYVVVPIPGISFVSDTVDLLPGSQAHNNFKVFLDHYFRAVAKLGQATMPMPEVVRRKIILIVGEATEVSS